jgi:hypothetical protein
VENQSHRITDPNIIREKANAYKAGIENQYSRVVSFSLFGLTLKQTIKTEVILDFTPPSKDDGPTGELIFDDRTSTAQTTVKHDGATTTTTKVTNSVPGDTKGEINQFKTSIGITMDGELVSDDDIASTAAHEGGHSGGLDHPWELTPLEKLFAPILDQGNAKTRDVKTIQSNVMNSAENPDPVFKSNGGPNVLLGQLWTLYRKIMEKSHFEIGDLIPAQPSSTPANPAKDHTQQ